MGPSSRSNCFIIQNLNDKLIDQRSRVLDNSIIKVARQVLTICLPQIMEDIKIEYHMQGTVKLVVKDSCKFFNSYGISVEPENLKVFFNGRLLSESERLKSLAISAGYVMEVFHD